MLGVCCAWATVAGRSADAASRVGSKSGFFIETGSFQAKCTAGGFGEVLLGWSLFAAGCFKNKTPRFSAGRFRLFYFLLAPVWMRRSAASSSAVGGGALPAPVVAAAGGGVMGGGATPSLLPHPSAHSPMSSPTISVNPNDLTFFIFAFFYVPFNKMHPGFVTEVH